MLLSLVERRCKRTNRRLRTCAIQRSYPRYQPLTIDEYLRKKLMPVEGVIPHLPASHVWEHDSGRDCGGDVFEYINFQQRYNIDARIAQANGWRMRFWNPLAPGQGAQWRRCACSVDGDAARLHGRRRMAVQEGKASEQ